MKYAIIFLSVLMWGICANAENVLFRCQITENQGTLHASVLDQRNVMISPLMIAEINKHGAINIGLSSEKVVQQSHNRERSVDEQIHCKAKVTVNKENGSQPFSAQVTLTKFFGGRVQRSPSRPRFTYLGKYFCTCEVEPNYQDDGSLEPERLGTGFFLRVLG